MTTTNREYLIEKINTSDNKQLAKFLLDRCCKYCIWRHQNCFGRNRSDCVKGVRKWLERSNLCKQ